MFGLFQRKEPQAALQAVIDPEVVPKQQKQYLDKVLGESRSVLDADVKGFDVLAAENGWQVYCKPVQGTEVGWRTAADVADAHAAATDGLEGLSMHFRLHTVAITCMHACT